MRNVCGRDRFKWSILLLISLPLLSFSAKAMSDREGTSGGAPSSDEDLSLPKATVAKMITGASLKTPSYNTQLYLLTRSSTS